MLVKSKILQILKTVISINRDETKRTAFFRYSGHIEGIEVEIYPNGWTDSDGPVNNCVFDIYETIEGEVLFYRSINYGIINRTKYPSFTEWLDAIKSVGEA